jgi:hypothetical protein
MHNVNQGMRMKNGVIKENGSYVAYVDGKEVGRGIYKYQADKALAAHEAAGVQEEELNSVCINKRFAFVGALTRMVAHGQTPAFLLVGPGGLGKTHTVTETLEQLGYTPSFLDAGASGRKKYTVVKGFSTAKGLYRLLYENKDGLLLLDDCDSALQDPDAAMLLKGALDTTDKRVICWNSSKEDDLPRSFVFNGGVIAVSNLSVSRVDQAVRTRAMVVDLAMTLDQKIERMSVIAESPKFMPSLDIEIKRNALGLIRKHKESAKEISLRSLVKVARVLNSGEDLAGELAEMILKQG